MLQKYCGRSNFFLIPPQISATTILFFFPSHFRQLGCHNSYFLSPQFPTILATWLPQLVNHSGTLTRALHGQSLGSGMNFDNTITEIHFFSLLVTSLNFLLSYTFSYNFGNGVVEIQSLSSFC